MPRTLGAKNKQTLDVKELAQDYTEAAVKRLAAIMNNDEAPPAAQVAAAKELLDRAHGKPKQSVDVAGGMTVTSIKRTIVDPSA